MLEWILVLLATWTVIGGFYWVKYRGEDAARKRVVIYPLFFMLRIPYGFESWGKYRGSIIARVYMVFTHIAAAISLVGIYYLIFQGIFSKYIAPPETGGATAGFIPLIPGVTIKGPLLMYIAFAVGVGAFFHELSHAFAARVSGIKVRNAGILLLAFIPAAFVEPDEEELRKASFRTRAFIYNAGTAANLAIALVALALLYTVATPPAGICIMGVDKGMPADIAGLREGDLIVAVNGTPIGDGSFESVYEKIPAGVNFTLTINRDGELMNVTVWKVEKDNRSVIGISIMGGMFCSVKSMMAYTMFWINSSLALVNMAPLFITDGGRLVNDFLERYKWGRQVSNAIQLATLLLFLSLITIPR